MIAAYDELLKHKVRKKIHDNAEDFEKELGIYCKDVFIKGDNILNFLYPKNGIEMIFEHYDENLADFRFNSFDQRKTVIKQIFKGYEWIKKFKILHVTVRKENVALSNTPLGIQAKIMNFEHATSDGSRNLDKRLNSCIAYNFKNSQVYDSNLERESIAYLIAEIGTGRSPPIDLMEIEKTQFIDTEDNYNRLKSLLINFHKGHLTTETSLKHVFFWDAKKVIGDDLDWQNKLCGTLQKHVLKTNEASKQERRFPESSHSQHRTAKRSRSRSREPCHSNKRRR
jgi:hypothetical protein